MRHYLDYNATAPLHPHARERMAELLAFPANPSSLHADGRMARKHLEDARKILADIVNVFPNEIIFTASATEANSMALRGFSGRRRIVSAIEHSSVFMHADATIPVTMAGIVDCAELENRLASGPASLVSVMLANNETGVVQPLAEISAICKKYGALLHCDAVQALGKIPLDFTALGADMMTIAAHKMGGPVGAAALVLRQDLAIAPLLIGGGQELRRRAGTENIAAIAAFAAAATQIDFAQMQRLRGWLDAMETALQAAGFLLIPSPAHAAPRLPNTSCIALPRLSQEVMLMKLDLAGFSVSAGSACSSGRIEPSHVLLAMGVAKEVAASAIRISGGWATTETDIRAITQALLQAVASL